MLYQLKSILRVLSLLLLLNIFLKPYTIFAQDFIKYPQNPIIKYDSSIPWKSVHVASSTVLYDDGIFKMWYDAHDGTSWKIAYATSTNGLNWEDYNMNPVLNPNNDGIENNVNGAEVIKESMNHFLMYYTATTNDNYGEVRLAESSDGIHWIKNPDFRFKRTQSWEHWGIANPMVTKDSIGYHMWYNSHDGSKWRIGYATSPNGIDWTKYNNNPLSIFEGNSSGAIFVLPDESKFSAWMHGGWGIPNLIFKSESTDYINWDNKSTILQVSPNPDDFDSYLMVAPILLVKDNKKYLYYSGFSKGHWQIGVAIKEDPVSEKTPVIIIPGFLASWNKEAILHNTEVSYDSWQMAPFIKDYEGIIATFKNLGYTENQDFFVFPYDWRKPIDADADNLNSFLQQKIWDSKPDSKINIVGHSLGGLVGRMWSQKYNKEKLNKIITVGSPHKGTAQVYKAVEAGDIDKTNDWLWLTEKMILILNKNPLETDKDTINNRFPVLRDLFPTYNFLKKNNELINVDSMQLKNNYLIDANGNISSILSKLSTVVGQSDNTLAGYNVGDRTVLDQLLNLYVDGRPINGFYETGDYLVLSSSAGTGNNIKTLSLDHGELIQKKEGLKEILLALDIPYEENQLIEGGQTIITPSLIFLIKSPAVMEVVSDGNTYQEQDGIIFIPNASSGDYELKVKGVEKGRYTVIVGQIGQQSDEWDTIEGEITADPPSNQIDIYNIQYNTDSPLSDTVNENNIISLFDELIIYLTNANQNLTGANKTNTQKAIVNLNSAKLAYQQNNKGKVKSSLLLSNQQINIVAPIRIYAADKLANLYDKALNNYNFGINVSALKKQINTYEKLIITTGNYLLSKKQSGKNVSGNSLLLSAVNNNLQKTKQNLENKNFNKAEILLKTIEQLSKELKKL